MSSLPSAFDRESPSPLRFLACPLSLWLAAFALRAVAIGLFDAPRAALGATPWQWGAEQASLADALARGDGFADPWAHGTGPSAWLAPVYPSLLCALMKLVGGVGPAAAWCLFLVQAAFDAGTAWLVLRIGRRLGRPGAGLLAGWLWVLYPLAIWHAAQTVWDTTLVAFAFTLFVERFLALTQGEHPERLRGALVSGLLFGALLLLNPAPQAVLPVLCLALVGVWPLPAGLARTSVFLAAALVVCLPWLLRNQRVLGTWQLRPNFGVETMIGNRDGAHGHPVPTESHPSHVEAERARYSELGEVAYSAECTERTLDWIRAHPGRFAALTALRVELFWLGRPPPLDPRLSGGVGAGRDPQSWLKWIAFLAVGALGLAGLVGGGLERRQQLLLAGLVILFGAPYYLSHVSERYRFPIDPLLVLLAALLLTRWLPDRLTHRLTKGRAIR